MLESYKQLQFPIEYWLHIRKKCFPEHLYGKDSTEGWIAEFNERLRQQELIDLACRKHWPKRFGLKFFLSWLSDCDGTVPGQFRQREGKQFSHKELADVLNCSVSQVKNVLSLAETLGLIHVEVKFNRHGGREPNLYQLNREKIEECAAAEPGAFKRNGVTFEETSKKGNPRKGVTFQEVMDVTGEEVSPASLDKLRREMSKRGIEKVGTGKHGVWKYDYDLMIVVAKDTDVFPRAFLNWPDTYEKLIKMQSPSKP